jgi:hypothetical protein
VSIQRTALLLLPFLLGHPGRGQRLYHGRIYDGRTDLVLQGVSVSNISEGLTNASDLGGNFRIGGKSGDTLVFSSVGFSGDSLRISSGLPASGLLIYLYARPDYLPSVTITHDQYTRDSLARRLYYRHFTDSSFRAVLFGDSSPTQGIGVNLHPIAYFSKDQREKRKLRKRLYLEERDAYIDARFSRVYVQRVTGLKGDSLQLFMFRYRPSYDFCRHADHEDLLLYINQQLGNFKKNFSQRGRQKKAEKLGASPPGRT